MTFLDYAVGRLPHLQLARLYESSDGAYTGSCGKDDDLLDGLGRCPLKRETLAHHRAYIHITTCHRYQAIRPIADGANAAIQGWCQLDSNRA